MESALSGGAKIIAFAAGAIVFFFVSAAIYLKYAQLEGN
jgi:hypothetical protein